MNRNITLLSILFLTYSLWGQEGGFDLSVYRTFLENNKNMTTSQLLEMYPAGKFEKRIYQTNGISYLDSISIKYNLTEAEIEMITRHGFVVTERLRKDTFGENFHNIYHADMPVYISSDAILHAWHRSYDEILKGIELDFLAENVKDILIKMHQTLPDLHSKYNGIDEMEVMLRDVDLYLMVALKLIGIEAAAVYPDNEAEVNIIISQINEYDLKTYPLFSENCRVIDFSQFKPRGHYEHRYWSNKLSGYFKAMMWLGRIELYLNQPIADTVLCAAQTESDIRRQTIDALLLTELIELAGQTEQYSQVVDLLQFLVGKSDNVRYQDLKELISELNLSGASDLLDPVVFSNFRELLVSRFSDSDKILSQILWHDPMSTEEIKPAISFMLFGQAFIIDSFISGNVVFDRIKYNDKFIPRNLPSTLDILFALGNDASIQLLIHELDKYHYSSNLAALRYLVDSFGREYWESSIYNMWLDAIRVLNPPSDRETLPQFMQTAAWWQQKMSTQLAAWTELRHDNLLYANQSYTGGYQCSYPYSYVEPVPDFFDKMHILATKAQEGLNDFPEISNYFQHLAGVTDTLKAIAEKELSGRSLSEDEALFLKNMLKVEYCLESWNIGYIGCGGWEDGWYPHLYYFGSYNEESAPLENYSRRDFLVMDYHTQPTDEGGNIIGKVAHSGTGPVELAVITAQTPDGQKRAYIGPVFSYYEYYTLNFKRLTDQEWGDSFLSQALRPEWSNLYLTDTKGDSKPGAMSLLTSVDNNTSKDTTVPVSQLLAINFPNPFNAGTVINFNVPVHLTHSDVNLAVFDIQGRQIRKLVQKSLPSGNYLVRWNGTNDNSRAVASGIYFYRLQIADQHYIGKMHYLK